MKYIFITFNGLSLPIAYKLHQDGFEVTVGVIENSKDYVPEDEVSHAKEDESAKKRRLELFDGMMPIQAAEKVVEKMKSIKNPHEYFVFFEENNLYRWADKVRDLGFEGNFPTRDDYLFETDRDMAKEFVKKHYPKLHTPEVVEFSKVAKAIEFLEKSDEIWVLKGQYDGASTFVPTTDEPSSAAQQIIEMLKKYPQDYEKMGFILEVYIPSMIELTPEKIYYDGVPLATTLDIENKNFGSANLSIQTGCAEDLVFPTEMEDRINKIAFPEIIDEMARNHKGLFIWDASLLINKRNGKIYFGEFCSNRPGYNSLFTELSQIPSINDFFEALVHKQSPFVLGTVGTSVRLFNLSTDPETEKVSGGLTIQYKPEIEKDVWLWDVKRNRDGQLVTVGVDWNLAVITGSGKSIDEAVTKMYKNIENIAVVGVYYRSKDDYLSHDYSTSILNRLNYGLERGLYRLPFSVKVGEIAV